MSMYEKIEDLLTYKQSAPQGGPSHFACKIGGIGCKVSRYDTFDIVTKHPTDGSVQSIWLVYSDISEKITARLIVEAKNIDIVIHPEEAIKRGRRITVKYILTTRGKSIFRQKEITI